MSDGAEPARGPSDPNAPAAAEGAQPVDERATEERGAAGEGGAVRRRLPAGAHSWTAASGQVIRNPAPALLEALGQEHLDPGYAAAARRKAAAQPPARRRSPVGRWTAVIGLAVVGLLFGVAAGLTRSDEPRTEKTRAALLEDVRQAESRQSELAATASAIADEVRGIQAQLGATGPLAELSELAVASGSTPVHGPGLRIVLDQAGGGRAGTAGGILDRDIQMLVNDLWAAGAEAIAIGDVRLRPTSSIRQAGGSILVDNRPVFWPLEIEAVGDASQMQIGLVGAPGVGRFNSYAQLYGIRFDVSRHEDLRLPAGSGPEPRYAQPLSPINTPEGVPPSTPGG